MARSILFDLPLEEFTKQMYLKFQAGGSWEELGELEIHLILLFFDFPIDHSLKTGV